MYSAAKIEEAVLDRVSDYFREIRHDVDSAWKENARKRLRDSAKARQKAAEARLVKLQTHQGALKAEIMKSITGESTFDTDLLKTMRRIGEGKPPSPRQSRRILHTDPWGKSLKGNGYYGMGSFSQPPFFSLTGMLHKRKPSVRAVSR